MISQARTPVGSDTTEGPVPEAVFAVKVPYNDCAADTSADGATFVVAADHFFTVVYFDRDAVTPTLSW